VKVTVNHTCIIILAAGSSSRLGRPKQLLAYNGKSLLRHAVSVALESGLGPVIVVTGSAHEQVRQELKNYRIHLAFNREWEEGMASSIRFGLETAGHLEQKPDGLLFMVCDQPFVTAGLLKDLAKCQAETGLPIAAARYNGTIGTPAIYHATVFPELKSLKGEAGAKKILQAHQGEVGTVPFSLGNRDIDTESDYQELLNYTSDKEA